MNETFTIEIDSDNMTSRSNEELMRWNTEGTSIHAEMTAGQAGAWFTGRYTGTRPELESMLKEGWGLEAEELDDYVVHGA